MQSNALITVIVPLYNKAPWVAQCISSIINQTYQNTEILVINDGSTDDSRTVVAAIDDDRIKIFDKLNGGVSSARNLGIEKAQGVYVAFIDADDEWRPRHLATLIKGFHQFKNAILVCDDLIEVYNNDKKNTTRRNLPSFLSASDTSTENYFWIDNYLQTLKNNYFILSGSSVLIKLSVVKEHQLKFHVQLTSGEDVNYWLQLSLIGKFVFCDYLGTYYRRIDNNSAMNKKTQTAKQVPLFFHKINYSDYNKEEQKNIKKFLSSEFYKKAFQNRGLPFGQKEFSTEVGGGIQLTKANLLVYVAIRFCPKFIFGLIKKLASVRG